MTIGGWGGSDGRWLTSPVEDGWSSREEIYWSILELNLGCELVALSAGAGWIRGSSECDEMK